MVARKSVLSMLYGKYVANGTIDLKSTWLPWDRSTGCRRRFLNSQPRVFRQNPAENTTGQQQRSRGEIAYPNHGGAKLSNRLRLLSQRPAMPL